MSTQFFTNVVFVENIVFVVVVVVVVLLSFCCCFVVVILLLGSRAVWKISKKHQN